MGAGVSSMLGVDGEGCSGPGLGDLPEACVASVLMNLDPPEICRLARLNRAFQGAASADFVWESKLPSNYGYMMEKIADERREKGCQLQEGCKRLSKKEVYSRLCRPNPFDGGAKMFWLEKSSGGVCLSMSSKALSITGIDDRRYWNHIPSNDSRFQTVAYLQQIWWFEVDGEIDFCFPAGKYTLFFRTHLGRPTRRLGRRACNPEHVHGWDIKPVRFQLSTSNGQFTQKQRYLGELGSWIYHEVGEFVVENSDASTNVKFSMMQIDCTHTKGGLCLDSVLICPSGVRPEKVFIIG